MSVLSKLVVKKQPYKKLFLKMGLITAALFVGGALFLSRYTFGYDGQIYKCIPGYSVYLIDKKDKALHKGKTYAFAANGTEPLIKNGTTLVKFLRGVPGDQVEIKPDTRIYINGEMTGGGLRYAERLGAKEEDFIGKAVIDGLWFMGTSIYSFDSRYWGVAQEDQVIGRAYPIF
jgi:conjugal transfer pilin signal peptidase TrbI